MHHHHALFAGSVPKEIGKLAHLTKLDLYDGYVGMAHKWQLPTEIGKLTELEKLHLASYRANYYVQCLARLNISDGEMERILSGLDTRGSSADITLTTHDTAASNLLVFLECSSTMRVGSAKAIEVVV